MAKLHVWELESEHPEASMELYLGEGVVRELFGDPDYIWQSSSASSDFEPKFSLTRH